MLRLASLVDDVAEAVAAATEDEDEISPSVSETFPRSALASEQTWRIPLTTEGRSGVSRTSVWLVLSKLQGAMVKLTRIYAVCKALTNRHTGETQTGTCLYTRT